jgi:hypothetical protein
VQVAAVQRMAEQVHLMQDLAAAVDMARAEAAAELRMQELVVLAVEVAMV